MRTRPQLRAALRKAAGRSRSAAHAGARTEGPFNTAAFYSISNCEPGLKGISLGNFLIKRVAERIQEEQPSVKHFCTLSPIPGLRAWLTSVDPGALSHWPARCRKKLVAAIQPLRAPYGKDLGELAAALRGGKLDAADRNRLTACT